MCVVHVIFLSDNTNLKSYHPGGWSWGTWGQVAQMQGVWELCPPNSAKPIITSFPHHFLFGTCWPSRFLGLPILQLPSPSTHFPPGQHWSTPGLRKATWIPHVGIQVFLEDHCEAQLLGSNSFPNQGEGKDPTAYSLFPQPRKAWRWPGTWMEHRDGEMGGRSQGGLPGGGCTLKEGRIATGVVF